VERVARDYFYYLENGEAETEVVLGDARISMQRELDDEGSNEFDVIVIDAFSGDAIPTHLVTDEAFDVYAEHLRDDGILAIHITNEYIDLSSLVRTSAQRLGMEAVWVEGPAKLWFEDYNDWVLVSKNRNFLNSDKLRSMQEPWPDSEFKPVRWTDDFSNLFELIDWGE
jgi:spermidine synthase